MKGCLVIHKKQLKKDDLSLRIQGVMIRFMNNGQSAVRIDEQIVVQPGEVYVEGDLSGPGIDHQYQIEFLDIGGSPKAPSQYITYAGNHLDVRIMKRK